MVSCDLPRSRYLRVVSAPMLLATRETFARLPHSFGQHSGSILARVGGFEFRV